MCGIYCHFHQGNKVENHKDLKPRGPDAVKVLDEKDYMMAFYRLAVVGKDMQPFDKKNIHLVCNGEIYNWKDLNDKYNLKCDLFGSDCQIILKMYKKFGIERTLKEIRGEFAFVLVDKKLRVAHFARDPIGIKPLYYRLSMDQKTNKVNGLELGSTVYSLASNGALMHVLPHHLYTYDIGQKIMSTQSYGDITYVPDVNISIGHIYSALKKAVEKRITQSDRKIGFFLSGGLDSCTVLSLALKSGLLKTPPAVFTFGFDKHAPDVKAARSFVNWLKKKYGVGCVDWHLIIGDKDKGFETIPEVIKILETYDTTTIRASTPMYMLSKYIRDKTDVAVVLSGEGSDELFGGYLYYRYAPNDHAFRSEIIKSLKEMYLYDVLRADRSTASCGLEIRPPFLDMDLIETVMSYRYLRKIKSYERTKPVLRSICKFYGLLPEDILNGRKEAFSDAVGLDWQDTVAAKSAEIMKKNYYVNYSYNVVPDTYVQKYFQMLFSGIVGKEWHLLPKLWLPNQTWVNTGSEPSARALDIYKKDPVVE